MYYNEKYLPDRKVRYEEDFLMYLLVWVVIVVMWQLKKLSMCKSSHNKLEKIAPNQFRVKLCPKSTRGNAYLLCVYIYIYMRNVSDTKNFPTAEKKQLTNFIMWTDEAICTD